MYLVINLIQEGSRKFNLHLCESRDEALTKFRGIVDGLAYGYDPKAGSKIVLEEKEDITQLRVHKWLWERKSHSEFAWIIEVETLQDVSFEYTDEFLNRFESDCVTHKDNVISKFGDDDN
jgi:hypothetical protein